MLILISTKILDMVLDLIEKGSFHLVMDLVESIMFGADMSSSLHANNKTKNILVVGKDFVQGLDNTTIYAENCIQLILLKIIRNFL